MDAGMAEQPEVAEATAPVETPPRRTLKLVVTLQPSDAHGYHAMLAVGADGCDPLLRCVEGESLEAILNAAPDLVAEAEARWRVQPRYPPIKPPAPSTAATPSEMQTEERALTADEMPTAPPKGEAAPGPSAAPAGQLSLFG